jgi:hypothetical protein
MRKKIIISVIGVLCAVVGGVAVYAWTQRTYLVTGTVTRDGKPLQWKSDNHELRVFFVSTDRERYPDVYKCIGDAKTGDYVIENVPPGEYLVSVQQTDPYPTHDLLNFAYDLKDSPLRCRVPEQLPYNIDLPKKIANRGRK